MSIGNLGFASTDTNGFFEFDGVPLGTYTLASSDPVNGMSARNTATVNYNGQTQTVQLVEATLGVVNGFVLDPYGNGFVPGATVRISFSDGVTPSRTVTTGPNGGFSFPGSPMGAFYLNASYVLPGAVNVSVSGQANGTLSASSGSVSVSIQLRPLTYLTVQVLRSDGVTPAQNTLVTLGGNQENTDTNGLASFSNLQVPGNYYVTAISQVGGDRSDGTWTNISLTSRGTNPVVTLVLPGVGSVAGTVVGSDGSTPVVNADVTLQSQAALFGGQSFTALTDAQGRFSFSDVPLGSFLITAYNLSLAASENGLLNTAGQTNQVTLRLGNSGTVVGQVVRADGFTPVADEDILIQFTSQSSNPGRAVYFTGPDGTFEFDNVPVGMIQVSSAAPDFGGIINFSTALTTNGQVLDLGVIPYDETYPEVVQVSPTNTSVQVPITNAVDLVFSKALDTNSVNATGIFIQGTNGTVTSTVTLLPDTNGVLRLVRVKPNAPLKSLQTYSVIVLAGNLSGPTGGILGSGPRDLVGRTLAAPFESDFATADNTPPQLLSMFPSNNAVQIDPSAVPRLVFDKTLNFSSFVFTLTGPHGAVPGSTSLGINGQVMTFLPTAFLLPNATYTMTVSNVFDLAGNSAVGQPYNATFATLDTIGPVIASLDIVSNAAPLAGTTVLVEAVLATNEAGASVRFTQDFNPIGTATNSSYQIPVTLPASGSTTIRAIATDRYGNDGQYVQLTIPVQPPQPPTLQFALVSPTNTPIPNGATVVVDVFASGDTAISNLVAVAGGGATGNLAATNGAHLRVQGVVATNASPYQQVQIFAQATDNLGLSSGQQVFSLPIRDATPPGLAILSPTNNGHLASGASFNLATFVADNSSNVMLNLVISGNLTVTQNVALMLSPNVPVTNVFVVPITAAPTNGGPIVATIVATDAASNSTSVASTFWLPNTPGPGIVSLVIASNLPPVAGLTVPIQALLATNQAGVSVRFIQDGSLVGVATNAPYQVLVKLPASGSTTISAIASDPYGNDGLVEQLVINVQPNVPPSIQFVRVSPASGPIPSGSAFEVDVIASGNSNLFQITASVGGAVSAANFGTNGSTLRVQGLAPATALAGQQVQITAQAVDGIGQSTGPQLLNLPVSDGTLPSLVVLSPPENTQLIPGQPLPLTVLVADNSSNVTIGLSITGAVTATQSVPLALTPNLPRTNLFTVPLPGEPSNGSPVIATITATDAANNSTTLARIFWLPGTDTTVTWNRQALGQTVNCTNGGSSYTWPNDNNWSQSVVLGSPCGAGPLVAIQPSNWSTTNYPDATNLDVILGGLGGAPANLDVSVALHSLTIQSDGGLNMANGTLLDAVNYDFESDGGITRNGSPHGLVLNGGTMSKTGGTNAFTIDPAIVLNSSSGTFSVNSGTLVLPGNGSYYTNGTFNITSNASLVLAPAGQSITLAGTLTGSGQGTVMVGAGTTINPGTDGVDFDLPDPLLNWMGGTLAAGNPVTNSGALTLSGTSDVVLNRTVQFNNVGLLRHSSTGRVNLYLNAQFENLASGTYDLESDGGLITTDYNPQNFDNFGMFRKSGGTNVSTISISFNNHNGSIEVDSGTLTLANSGSSSNGTFTVAAGSVVDLTGGQSPTWAGLIQGTGAGHLELNSGTLSASPSLTLNCPDGFFQWSGGNLGGTILNNNEVTVSGSSDVVLLRQTTFNNVGLLRHSSTGRVNLYLNAQFENLASGTYDLESDGGLITTDYNPQNFDNFGMFRKSGGTNVSTISISFNNHNGSIEVDSGTLTLANSGSSSNGTFTVAAGSVVDLTGGQSPTWAGLIQGTGAGHLELNSGTLSASPSLTLNCPDGFFQWSGGNLGGTILNNNEVTVSGSSDVVLLRQTTFNNVGLLRHSSTGRVNLYLNAQFENLASGTYDLESDGGLITTDYNPQNFDNFGMFRKSGGTNVSTISISFNNHNGSIEVDSGTLTLANSGSSSNGTFTVAAGSALDLTGGQSPTWSGQMNGQGAGTVLLTSGTLNASSAVALNFPNQMFQWMGGGILNGLFTNGNVVNVSGTNSARLLMERLSQLINPSLVRQTSSGSIDLRQNARFENLPTGTYDLQSDSGLYTDDYNPQFFDNYGIVRKSGGTGNSVVSAVLFNNLGGVVDVDSGMLTLANSGSSSNGTFNVAAGSVVDIAGGQSPTWSGLMSGQGSGEVVFGSGTLNAGSGVALNFTNQMFQWMGGGTLNGLFTNLNVVNVSGTNSARLLMERLSQLINPSLVRQTSSGSIDLRQNARFENLPTGTYELQADSGVYSDDYAPQYFDNYGIVRKSGGTNTSTISVTFNNQNGSLEVDSGILNLGNNTYVQGNGAFTVQLGGTNTGEFGQLNVAKANLNGILNVKLADGYVPALGDQYQILSCPSYSGTFGSTAMPGGVTVNYSSNGVFLVVTGAVSILPPAIVSQPVNVTNVTGGTALFQVEVSGSPPMGFQWQFKGADLANTDRISGSQNDTLLVAGLSAADVGDYRVMVTNSAGSVISQPASLTLLAVPSYSYLVTNTPNLLGYWPFTSALQANSAVAGITGSFVGNAAVGPAGSGPALPDQPGNTAAVLDGNGDYVSTSLAGGLSPTGPYANQGSIIGWFRLDTLPSIAGRIFTIAGESLSGDDFDLQIETDNKIKFYTDSGGATVDGAALTVNDTNVWHFVAATFSANVSRNLYLDGTLVAGSVPGNHDSTRGGSFAMGESQVFHGRFFQGHWMKLPYSTGN